MIARKYVLQGLVQGQGVRPAVARLANKTGVAGNVRNVSDGVEVNASGQPDALDSFARLLGESFTTNAVVQSSLADSNVSETDFQILESTPANLVRTVVPHDTATCAACMDEVRNVGSRRYRYPFTSCASCGPRYSIAHAMPFDRSRTSMAAFPMCTSCRSEYETLSDRRFHAQTSSCPACGPRCWTTNQQGNSITDGNDAIEMIAAFIRDGQIAAIKGLGGYQLLVDGTNDQAVQRLRKRKQRPTKPFPLMVPDMEAVMGLADISPLEESVLKGPENPIVLLRSNGNQQLSQSIHPGLTDIGLMLPTTPLHWLLLDLIQRPVVVTSANLHGCALVCEFQQSLDDLSSIVDIWLHHNRDIVRPVDDSVVRCVGRQCMTIRAGRGIAPLTLTSTGDVPMVAFGGHQKVAPAICSGKHFVLGPHVGDMESESCRQRCQQQADGLRRLYSVESKTVVCDQHPDFFTTAWALSQTTKPVQVQHHHAHVAAALLEHELTSETVLGFTFDGTGYGSDQAIWGGEVLIANANDFQRVAHLRPFRLPGGEAVVWEPWRTAISLLQQSCGPSSIDQWSRRFGSNDIALMQYMIDHGPLTTSMGRLFDGVAAIAGVALECTYEGEPAIMLESVCDRQEPSSYEFKSTDAEPVVLDWRAMIRQITEDINKLTPGQIAMKFHRAVANMVVEVAARFPEVSPVLCGGVFQNRLLLELIEEAATPRGIRFLLPGRIPANDGGLAMGQLVVGSAKLQHEDSLKVEYKCV